MQDAPSAQSAAQFGPRIRKIREAENMPQRELCERLERLDVKLDTSAITRIEAGSRDPRLREALAIAEALETDLGELLTGFVDQPGIALFDALFDLRGAAQSVQRAQDQYDARLMHLQGTFSRPDVQTYIAGLRPRTSAQAVQSWIGDMIDNLEKFDGRSFYPAIIEKLAELVGKDVLPKRPPLGGRET